MAKALRPIVFPYYVALVLVLSVSRREAAHAYPNTCRSDEFMCKDESCILQEKMCDGRLDCQDNSDEIDCDFKLCLKPDWFQCRQPDGPCLSADLLCNGVENCPGGEDELDCAGMGGYTADWLTKRNCSDSEFTCESDKTCIPLDFVCDGKVDCSADRSDEVAGCANAEKTCRGFLCKNRKCLGSRKWVCDGSDDCGDSSDEQNCEWNCKPEVNKFLCHNNATCLDLAKVCDGHADCSDGSDESAMCNASNNCQTTKCPPAAKCQMMPASGVDCVCPKGFRYAKLQNACVDIDECREQFGLCSHMCENLSGSYKCRCDDGYRLRADNHTCEAHGEEALLLYSTQVTVMGMHLRSKRLYTVAKNLTKVIGVSYDGSYIYWTNIQNEEESIVKSKPDGTHHEVLLTSGLDAPEDLAVDWLTGNIYFSDNVMRHIAVCSNDGMHCTVVVTIDVHHPRGVALWPQKGQIFWTDWGVKPMIARASMDGSNSQPIVTENIHWPNGIALDMHNNRLYWVDAKVSTMESVRPDGSDRRVVLDEIMKHPYGLAIFEDQIYWSDWGTKSIHACNKFTGKDHKVINKDRTMYAVHIYHSAKQPRSPHACQNNRCSHLCLLAENNRSTCACPDGMQLAADHMRCVKTAKKQRLFMGIKNMLLEMEHTTFGRHRISHSYTLPIFVHEMAYNSVNGSVLIADNIEKIIADYDVARYKMDVLVAGNLGNVSGLAFDWLSRSVYWTDSERHVVEVFSLSRRTRAIVSFFSGMEVPIGLAVMPDEGDMFVALRSRRHVHIDKKRLSGEDEHVHVFEDELGDDDIKFATDYDMKTLYWADSEAGRISFTDYRQLKPYTFRSRMRRPFSLAIVDDDLFWSSLKSSTLYWTHKSNLGPLKRVDIELTKDAFSHVMMPLRIPLLASTPRMIVAHPCQRANGGCSHVCVTRDRSRAACLCPAGLIFRDATNRTCIESEDCEFRCGSGECLTNSRRCNGRKECPDGSDEVGCDASAKKRPKVICGISEFMCHDEMQCLSSEQRCDGTPNCRDGSDERHCDKFDATKKCHRHQHACDNGNCVDFSSMCDGVNDCGDNSDETNCKVAGPGEQKGRPVCDKDMFQCTSGTCIAKSWECDGKLDCVDGSDEHDKCELKECGANMHKCLLGQCVEMRLVCDGHDDCGDSSDELNCEEAGGGGKRLQASCGDDPAHPMFQCPSNSSVCLEMSAKCNGTAECPRGEDEDCGNECGLLEFQCKTDKKCIHQEFRCDHEPDCSDGSDELNCEHRHSNGTLDQEPAHERACEPGMFNCRDGKCVEMNRVCDDFEDCDTGADEGPLCKSSCKATVSGKAMCQHRCRPTPNGAVCSCFAGYKLEVDQRSCVDINECEEQDPCAQVCENLHGSYRCSCYPDFMLRPDKTSCKSIESDSSLMFSTYDEVRSMTEQPVVLRVAWSANDSKISGFDVNVRRQEAFFTTDSEDILYEVELARGEVKAGLSVERPSKVAVDWITDNVYVIERSKHYHISVCSFSLQMCNRIVKVNPRESLKALAVDAFNRHLFYVQIRSPLLASHLSQIFVANLDGQKRELLHLKNGAHVTAISPDPFKRVLYFLDSQTKTLQAISYKPGSSRRANVIIRRQKGIRHPTGLTVYENQAFLVNVGSKEAIRCQLYGSRVCKPFNLNILNADEIVVNGTSRQPLATNPCAMAKCSGMCVQAEHGYECMCDNEIVPEHKYCSPQLSNAITASALLKRRHGSDGEGGSTHHTWLVAGLMLGIAVLLLLGYLYYRRLQEGHRDLNINLHFQNPLASLDGSGGSKMPPPTSGAHSSYHEQREKIQMATPIHRLLCGSKTQAESEILLQTATAPPQAPNPLGQFNRLPSIMVEEDADDDSAGTNGYHEDDPRLRLVS